MLQQAEVLGILPTPLAIVAEQAGIDEIIDISDLPAELAAQRLPVVKRLLGALMFRERVAFVDHDQPASRVRFTTAHETGHRIIPWHERSFHLDHEDSLFKETRNKLEAEANLAGAHLIFQGRRFHARALEYQLSIHTPLKLADLHAASRHATIRYYVEHHHDPVALVIAGHYPRPDGSLPIWSCIESPTFRFRFGRLTKSFRSGRLAASEGLGQLLDGIIQEAMVTDSVPATDVTVQDVDGGDHDFIAEAFFNQHCLFILLAQRRARRFGRRLYVRAG